MKSKGTFYNEFICGNIHIIWDKILYRCDEEPRKSMRFIHRDILSLVKAYNECNENAAINTDLLRIITINDIYTDIDQTLNLFDKSPNVAGLLNTTEIGISNALSTFVSEWKDEKDTIIVSDMSPVNDLFNTISFRSIRDVENLQDDRYKIDNTGCVYEGEDMETMHTVYTEDGPYVLLVDTNFKTKAYSVNYLMTKAFNSSAIDNEFFNKSLTKQLKIFEFANFISINNYSGFEYSNACIYKNSIGEKLINQANKELEESKND